MAAQLQAQGETFKLGALTLILTVLAMLSAGGTIAAEIFEAEVLVYILKPLTIGLIILVAILSGDPPARSYKFAIVLGLLFSMAGDVLLMIPEDWFLWGLIAFAATQLAYTSAFISGNGFYRNYRSAVPFLLYGVFMAAFLWTGLEQDGMLVPALAYLVIILVMAWQGYGNWRQTLETRSLLAFAGVLLFVASDSFLAVNRFAFDLGTLSPILVLGTYYPAQWLIAQSAGRKHP